MTVRRVELAEGLHAHGLWRHLPADVQAANIAAVAHGTHPWATTIASDVQFFADGEDLAEGGVEAFLQHLTAPLAALGVNLRVETVSRPESGAYVVSINGDTVRLWDQCSGTSDGEVDNPWFTASVRPLAALNALLANAGAVERLFTLYTGGNEGLVLLIDPAVVAELVNGGFATRSELPVQAR